jgi:hypothetical protein
LKNRQTTRRILSALAVVLAFASVFVLRVSAEDIQFETRVPLGLAHDGQILWIADAQTRELTGYDIAQKKQLATKTLSFDVRDIAFWAPNLVTVAPNYIYVINPLNGDLVDKILLKGITDPVAIALDMHQAYIYDRADRKVHRVHMVDKLQFGSFTPDITADIRSMTFYKGFLWAIAKDGKAYKLQPSDGAQVSFLPLPQGSYGISFVDGGMYVARPGQVRSIDFIETENYVAAARRNFTITSNIDLTLPWSAEERARESKMQLKYSLLPMTAHQRITGLRATPSVRFGRREDGSHYSDIQLSQNSTEKSRRYKLQFQATLFNLTHIFNPPLIKQYFREPELPESVRAYLDRIPVAKSDQATLDQFRAQWLSKSDGKHPIYLIAAMTRDKSISDALRCPLLRNLGVPCRNMRFYDLDSNQTKNFLQVFIQPTGWVTLTADYDATKPKEFPVANHELELFSPEDLAILPREKIVSGAPKTAGRDLLQMRDVRVITSSTE